MSIETEVVKPSEFFSTIAPGIHLIGAMGNSVAVETTNGVVQVDTGGGRRMPGRMIAKLRSVTDLPVHAILYSHGHLGYNFGIPAYQAHAEERGDPPPRLIAHANLVLRYDRYIETAGLQEHLNRMQFPDGGLGNNISADQFCYPTETFTDSLTIDGGNRQIEVFHAPSETDDAIGFWISEERVLYGGSAVIQSCPNVGTPLRTIRDAIRWAETLEAMIAREPDLLIPEWGQPLEGKEQIADVLGVGARSLRYLRTAVVERMNAGMTDHEIIHDMEYPPEIFEHPAMKPIYGCPEYIVRDIYRAENGWWTSRNPTDLHPGKPDDVAAALLAAISDRETVLKTARSLRDSGQPQLALHVLDLLAQGPVADADVRAAREMKADLLESFGQEHPSVVSRNIYRSGAKRLRG
ncbi:MULTISPECIES: alkyl sulfatase dimerization domain-containing protein [unclassified Minwuia]|jgi:alkyl sulfatase BDS1-like metallo-beta-lactamase superfamily hydrolase|uniref:alkyl sulfatase dimerization domain-containing protein n=1 Tax=unclassified Minwuia TaxID=2618799 RepID=UPI00247A9674|nr:MULTISPECIES: alkyl sulfatase dimerization domain-containing protein [unclassified Minwuia]